MDYMRLYGFFNRLKKNASGNSGGNKQSARMFYKDFAPQRYNFFLN